MENNIPIKITEDKILEGNNPVVLIGPNGSGKTIHGTKIASLNGADMVTARRNITIERNVGMRPIEEASRVLTNRKKEIRSTPWQLSNETDFLFSKLLAENAEDAIKFRDNYFKGERREPDETKMMKLISLWMKLFPGREIDFSDYTPKVRSGLPSANVTYPAQQMSDGERVALYLTARILETESKIIIIDEPEVHFHSRLAVRFWNELEKLRDDCRFLYPKVSGFAF